MPVNDLLIGVDAGTQSVRAGLYSADGVLLASSQREATLLNVQGGIEQSPDELYGALTGCIRDAVEIAHIDPARVACCSIDGQMAGVIAVDAAGNAAGNYDSWLDERSMYLLPLLRENEERVIRLTGGVPTNAHGIRILRRVKEGAGDCRAFVPLSAYLSMRLTGTKEAYYDDTHLHFSGFADNLKREWDEELSRGAIDVRSFLPRIRRPSDIVGGLSAHAAALTGLLPGTPVCAGCGDTAACALGAGVTREDMALDVAGTASVFAMSTRDYRPDVKKATLLYMRSPIDGLFCPLAYIGGGGLCIRWVRDITGKTYEELEEMASKVPSGSRGLMFSPHFAGRVCPADAHMKGGWYGLSWQHGPGEMYRSVLESIAFEYRFYLDILSSSGAFEKGGTVIGTGGGAKSRLFGRIKADALGMEYRACSDTDTGLRGSALLAGMACGLFKADGSDLPSPALSDPILPDPSQEDECVRLSRRQQALAGVLSAAHEVLL